MKLSSTITVGLLVLATSFFLSLASAQSTEAVSSTPNPSSSQLSSEPPRENIPSRKTVRRRLRIRPLPPSPPATSLTEAAAQTPPRSPTIQGNQQASIDGATKVNTVANTGQTSDKSSQLVSSRTPATVEQRPQEQTTPGTVQFTGVTGSKSDRGQVFTFTFENPESNSVAGDQQAPRISPQFSPASPSQPPPNRFIKTSQLSSQTNAERSPAELAPERPTGRVLNLLVESGKSSHISEKDFGTKIGSDSSNGNRRRPVGRRPSSVRENASARPQQSVVAKAESGDSQSKSETASLGQSLPPAGDSAQSISENRQGEPEPGVPRISLNRLRPSTPIRSQPDSQELTPTRDPAQSTTETRQETNAEANIPRIPVNRNRPPSTPISQQPQPQELPPTGDFEQAVTQNRQDLPEPNLPRIPVYQRPPSTPNRQQPDPQDLPPRRDFEQPITENRQDQPEFNTPRIPVYRRPPSAPIQQQPDPQELTATRESEQAITDIRQDQPEPNIPRVPIYRRPPPDTIRQQPDPQDLPPSSDFEQTIQETRQGTDPERNIPRIVVYRRPPLTSFRSQFNPEELPPNTRPYINQQLNPETSSESVRPTDNRQDQREYSTARIPVYRKTPSSPIRQQPDSQELQSTREFEQAVTNNRQDQPEPNVPRVPIDRRPPPNTIRQQPDPQDLLSTSDFEQSIPGNRQGTDPDRNIPRVAVYRRPPSTAFRSQFNPEELPPNTRPNVNQPLNPPEISSELVRPARPEYSVRPQSDPQDSFVTQEPFRSISNDRRLPEKPPSSQSFPIQDPNIRFQSNLESIPANEEPAINSLSISSEIPTVDFSTPVTRDPSIRPQPNLQYRPGNARPTFSSPSNNPRNPETRQPQTRDPSIRLQANQETLPSNEESALNFLPDPPALPTVTRDSSVRSQFNKQAASSQGRAFSSPSNNPEFLADFQSELPQDPRIRLQTNTLFSSSNARTNINTQESAPGIPADFIRTGTNSQVPAVNVGPNRSQSSRPESLADLVPTSSRDPIRSQFSSQSFTANARSQYNSQGILVGPQSPIARQHSFRVQANEQFLTANAGLPINPQFNSLEPSTASRQSANQGSSNSDTMNVKPAIDSAPNSPSLSADVLPAITADSSIPSRSNSQVLSGSSGLTVNSPGLQTDFLPHVTTDSTNRLQSGQQSSSNTASSANSQSETSKQPLYITTPTPQVSQDSSVRLQPNPQIPAGLTINFLLNSPGIPGQLQPAVSADFSARSQTNSQTPTANNAINPQPSTPKLPVKESSSQTSSSQTVLQTPAINSQTNSAGPPGPAPLNAPENAPPIGSQTNAQSSSVNAVNSQSNIPNLQPNSQIPTASIKTSFSAQSTTSNFQTNLQSSTSAGPTNNPQPNISTQFSSAPPSLPSLERGSANFFQPNTQFSSSGTTNPQINAAALTISTPSPPSISSFQANSQFVSASAGSSSNPQNIKPSFPVSAPSPISPSNSFQANSQFSPANAGPFFNPQTSNAAFNVPAPSSLRPSYNFQTNSQFLSANAGPSFNPQTNFPALPVSGPSLIPSSNSFQANSQFPSANERPSFNLPTNNPAFSVSSPSPLAPSTSFPANTQFSPAVNTPLKTPGLPTELLPPSESGTAFTPQQPSPLQPPNPGLAINSLSNGPANPIEFSNSARSQLPTNTNTPGATARFIPPVPNAFSFTLINSSLFLENQPNPTVQQARQILQTRLNPIPIEELSRKVGFLPQNPPAPFTDSTSSSETKTQTNFDSTFQITDIRAAKVRPIVQEVLTAATPSPLRSLPIQSDSGSGSFLLRTNSPSLDLQPPSLEPQPLKLNSQLTDSLALRSTSLAADLQTPSQGPLSPQTYPRPTDLPLFSSTPLALDLQPPLFSGTVTDSQRLSFDSVFPDNQSKQPIQSDLRPSSAGNALNRPNIEAVSTSSQSTQGFTLQPFSSPSPIVSTSSPFVPFPSPATSPQTSSLTTSPPTSQSTSFSTSKPADLKQTTVQTPLLVPQPPPEGFIIFQTPSPPGTSLTTQAENTVRITVVPQGNTGFIKPNTTLTPEPRPPNQPFPALSSLKPSGPQQPQQPSRPPPQVITVPSTSIVPQGNTGFIKPNTTLTPEPRPPNQPFPSLASLVAGQPSTTSQFSQGGSFTGISTLIPDQKVPLVPTTTPSTSTSLPGSTTPPSSTVINQRLLTEGSQSTGFQRPLNLDILPPLDPSDSQFGTSTSFSGLPGQSLQTKLTQQGSPEILKSSNLQQPINLDLQPPLDNGSIQSKATPNSFTPLLSGTLTQTSNFPVIPTSIRFSNTTVSSTHGPSTGCPKLDIQHKGHRAPQFGGNLILSPGYYPIDNETNGRCDNQDRLDGRKFNWWQILLNHGGEPSTLSGSNGLGDKIPVLKNPCIRPFETEGVPVYYNTTKSDSQTYYREEVAYHRFPDARNTFLESRGLFVFRQARNSRDTTAYLVLYTRDDSGFWLQVKNVECLFNRNEQPNLQCRSSPECLCNEQGEKRCTESAPVLTRSFPVRT